MPSLKNTVLLLHWPKGDVDGTLGIGNRPDLANQTFGVSENVIRTLLGLFLPTRTLALADVHVIRRLEVHFVPDLRSVTGLLPSDVV